MQNIHNHFNSPNIVKSILFLSFLLGTAEVTAQCTPEVYSLKCIDNLKEDFLYMRSYNIDGSDGSKNKIEYTAVLSKNVLYALKICTELNDPDGIVLTIYNPGREIITSNRQDDGDGTRSEVEFYCNATGIYYLTFTFQNSKRSCGGCILSFKK